MASRYAGQRASSSRSRRSSESSIPCVSSKRERSASGGRVASCSKVASLQGTKPLGGPWRGARFAPVFAFASARLLAITCSGAWHTTSPRTSKPLRPARPAIWRNSRTVSSATFSPFHLESLLKTTVRIGMLTPTPSVSVPNTTCRSPRCARRSTSRRYFGSMPAWCTPTPCATRRFRSLPKGVSKRKSPTASAIFARASRSAKAALVAPCASSAHSRCVKFTTYTGERPPRTSASSVSCSGVSRYS